MTEARERQKAGIPPGPDTWRADLDPRSAVRARTIPVLKNEREELLKRLESMENENLELQEKMVESYRATKSNSAEVTRRLDVLEKVLCILPLR